jgi:putative transposase
MSYSRLFYHFIWTTKQRLPLIDESNRSIIYEAIKKKVETVGGMVHTLNGMEDDIHLVASVPPTLALSKFIGEVKGVSSFVAAKATSEPFGWQSEYGVLTVSESHLATVINYVKMQKEHHRANTLDARLESC